MTKASKWIAAILSVLMLLTLGGQLALGWFNYQRAVSSAENLDGLRKDNSALLGELTGMREELSGLHEELVQLREAADAPEDPGQEDDVTIAGDYVIRSTLPISDAYHSGDRSALSDKEKETLDMASGILEEIITPEMDAYEKETAVYLWMTANLGQDEGLLPVIPRTQADCDNPYGVLKYHNAVCVGYATTFRLFMQMLDIPCMVVHNSERYHSWDLVQLDGGWYHTDIYSDAGQGDFSHFNLPDVMQMSNQDWNTDFFPPANRYEYCYVVRNSVEETDLYHIPADLRAAIDERAPMLGLRFGDLSEVDAQIVEMIMDNVQGRVEYGTYSDQMYMYWNWLPLEQGYLLAVNMNWYDQGGEDPEPEPEFPEDAYEKIEEAMEEAFGDMEQQVWYDSSEDVQPVG